MRNILFTALLGLAALGCAGYGVFHLVAAPATSASACSDDQLDKTSALDKLGTLGGELLF